MNVATTVDRPSRLARQFLRACLATAILSSAVLASPLDDLLARVEQDESLTPDMREFIANSWKECKDCTEDEFLIQTLSAISPQFRAGLDAFDAEGYDKSAQIMRELSNSDNPFLSVNAAAFEIKALVSAERYKDAIERIDDLTADDAQRLAAYSYFEPEVEFLRGVCLLSDLQYDAAFAALSRFLDRYPEAPMRLRISADQMLAELENRQSENIGEVADLMTYASQRLVQGDTGEKVQQRQQKIVDILDKLIEQAEQQEQNASNSDGSNNPGGGGGPSQPMPDSQLPGGSAESGPLRPGRTASPAEAWGSMPPAERERIMQALKGTFPSRYRTLLEQYYAELAKRP